MQGRSSGGGGGGSGGGTLAERLCITKEAGVVLPRRKPKTAPDRLFPYDCCDEFLTTHPLVMAFRVAPRDVHTVLLHLDLRLSSDQPTAPSHDDDKMWEVQERRGCIECGDVAGARVELDARAGCEVCVSCGLVQTRGTINVIREFQSEDEPTRRNRNARGVKGVPDWMLKASLHNGWTQDATKASQPFDSRRRSVLDDLEHMNQFVHLTTDQLRTCDAWVMNGLVEATTCGLVAVLLYPLVRDQFPKEEEDVRTRIRNHVALDVLVDPVPAPTFACPTCDVLCHSRRHARFHCR